MHLWPYLSLSLGLLLFVTACQRRPGPGAPTPPAARVGARAAPRTPGGRPTPARPQPTARGAYATGTSRPDAAELAWLRRFRQVHAGGLGDPLPPDAVQSLRRGGVEILWAYDWLPATYHYTDGQPDDPLTAWLYANRFTLTLNPQGPFPHCTAEGYTWCQDFYFDLGNPTVRARRVAFLKTWTQEHGYDGVFFDWGNAMFLEEPAYASLRRAYRQRHPDLPYPQAVALFWQALRDQGVLVQANQAYRNAEALWPAIDADMAESYATTDQPAAQTLLLVGQGTRPVPLTVYFPVSEDPTQGRLDDTLEVLRHLQRLRTRFPRAVPHGLVLLNYAAPRWEPQPSGRGYRAARPRNAIYYAYALGRLVGFPTYTEVPWDHALERDEVYFYDLGAAVEADYRALPQGGYVRFYRRGLALVGWWPAATTIVLRHPSLPAQGWAYDLYRGQWLTVDDHSLALPVTPEADPLTGRVAPLGRIVLYAPGE